MDLENKEVTAAEKTNGDFIDRMKATVDQELEAARVFTVQSLSKYRETQDPTYLKTVVSLGSLLWDFRDVIDSTLELVKEDVRQAAIDSQEDGYRGHVPVPGLFPEDNCHVNIPKVTTKLQSSADVDSLKEILGRTFDLFITTKYDVAKDFESHIEKVATDSERNALLEVIEQRENKPRVSFKRKKPS